MSNFIFISPNFPTNYWQFCRELKNDGMNVLGIGDQPYDELKPELKDSLNEYYKVGSLENYDEVYRAVAFFAFKYGRISVIASQCHLPQSGRPWQSLQSSRFCQRLALWESWQSRKALTERVSRLILEYKAYNIRPADTTNPSRA